MNNSYKESLHGIDMDSAKKEQLESLLAREIEAQAARPHALPKRRSSKRTVKAALAFAACLALCGGAAYGIVNNSSFFDNAFGNSDKADLPVEQVQNAEKGEELYWPATDYAAVDQETASRLLDNAVCSNPASLTFPDGHELAVEKSVRSENFLVYSFTLHRDGGVTGLTYSEDTNRDKGAWFTDKRNSIYWELGTFQDEDLFSGNSNLMENYIYVDLEKSTDDTVVGYGYGEFEEAVPAGQAITLHAFTQDDGKKASKKYGGGYWTVHKYSDTATLECTDVVSERTFASDGGQVCVSPLGITYSYDNGSGFSTGSDMDTALTITYKDGSQYEVFKSDDEGDGSSDIVKNYFSGVFDKLTKIAFNRLVDPDAIESITLEQVDYDGNSNEVIFK